jgi:hypothetical protein
MWEICQALEKDCPIERKQKKGSDLRTVQVVGNSVQVVKEEKFPQWQVEQAIEWVRMLHGLTGTTFAQRCTIISDSNS